MSSTESKVADALAAERNDTSLQGLLASKLAEYLIGTLKVKEVPRDLPETIEEWATAASEAFKGDLPAPFEARLKRWLAGSEAVKVGPGLTPPSGLGGAKGGTTPGPLSLVAAELGTTPASIQDDFDKLSITTHTRDKAIADMKSQGMLPTRTFALSVSMETGRVHSVAELAGMTYGSDVRATSLVKDLRKAKIPLLSTALEGGKMTTVLSHLNGLLRDLAAHGQMHEAALLSGWMQEWQQMFSAEDAIAIAYLIEYLRVYPGRGLPTPFDYGIMFRVQKASGTTGSSEVKELAKEVKSMKNTINNLQEQCASLKKKGEASARQLEAVQRNNRGPGNNPNVVCNHCGEKGHIARFCPNKDTKQDDEKE